MRAIVSISILCLALASCGGPTPADLAPAIIPGHSDAEMAAIAGDRDAIRKRLDADAKLIAHTLADDKLLQAQDTKLAVEQRQARFFWIAIITLFATGALLALSIYAGGFTLLGAPAAVILRGAAYAAGGLSAIAFLCDWLAPYAWWLGLGAVLTAIIGALVWLLHRSDTAKKLMADGWFAAATELQKHAPDVKTRLDEESIARQVSAGVKSHVDAFLKRI